MVSELRLPTISMRWLRDTLHGAGQGLQLTLHHMLRDLIHFMGLAKALSWPCITCWGSWYTSWGWPRPWNGPASHVEGVDTLPGAGQGLELALHHVLRESLRFLRLAKALSWPCMHHMLRKLIRFLRLAKASSWLALHHMLRELIRFLGLAKALSWPCVTCWGSCEFSGKVKWGVKLRTVIIKLIT